MLMRVKMTKPGFPLDVVYYSHVDSLTVRANVVENTARASVNVTDAKTKENQMKIKFQVATGLFVAALSLSTPSFAGADVMVDGTPVADNDCDSNKEHYTWSDCAELGAYRIQGIVYNDLNGQDRTDAIGAMCRKYGTAKGTEVEIAADYWNSGNHKDQKQPQTFMCEPNEVLAGIACKDEPKNDDSLDGCTAVCQVPGKESRLIPNPDLDNNSREYVYHTVNLPNRVSAIGYKEAHGNTDYADCGNVAWKLEPIVK
jgi:hypothetical protein